MTIIDDIVTDAMNEAAKQRLQAFVERIERLVEEKAALTSDLREVYAEAKAAGYDKKALTECVRVRAADLNEWRQQQGVNSTYLHALGLI